MGEGMDAAWTLRRLMRLRGQRHRLAWPLAGCLLTLGWLLANPGGHFAFPRDYLLVFTWFDSAFRLRPTLHLAPLAFYASLMGSLVCGGQCYALTVDIGRLRRELTAGRRPGLTQAAADGRMVRG